MAHSHCSWNSKKWKPFKLVLSKEWRLEYKGSRIPNDDPEGKVKLGPMMGRTGTKSEKQQKPISYFAPVSYFFSPSVLFSGL